VLGTPTPRGRRGYSALLKAFGFGRHRPALLELVRCDCDWNPKPLTLSECFTPQCRAEWGLSKTEQCHGGWQLLELCSLTVKTVHPQLTS
jgi:hypothetical protein